MHPHPTDLDSRQLSTLPIGKSTPKEVASQQNVDCHTDTSRENAFSISFCQCLYYLYGLVRKKEIHCITFYNRLCALQRAFGQIQL